MKIIRRERGGEAGQAVLVLVVLSLLILCAFAGLATDVGMFFRGRRILQTEVDSAAIAGAAELSFGGIATAAQNDAATNGLATCTNKTNVASVPAPTSPATCTLVVNNPPLNGPHTCSSDATNCHKYVEVMALQNEPTFFTALFGWGSLAVQARAVAYPGSGSNEGCIYALKPTATDISLNDAASSLAMPNCAMYADSSNSKAIDAKNSTISAKYIGIVGGYNGNVVQGNPPTQPPITGMVPVKDPLAYIQSYAPTPSGSCAAASGSPLNPGYYCSIGGTDLKPGLYIVHDGVSFNNGSLTCTTCTGSQGVTIYFVNNSGIDLHGNATITLPAEKCSTIPCVDGAFNDIVLWSSGTGGITGHGNPTFNLTGILYFPSADLSFWGSSGGASNVSIIAQTIAIGGAVTINGIPVSGGISPIDVATLSE